jgi:hypothetical protein
MNVYEVRYFINNFFTTVRTYGTLEEAEAFTQALKPGSVEWDIKETTLDEANKVGA